MKILNDEQLNYLKSLDSKKKRIKFMLDCLVENLIGESAKIDTSKVVVFKDGVFKTSDPEMICAMNAWVDKTELFTSTTAPRTFEGLGIPNLIKKKMEGCKRIGDRFFKEKHVFKNNDLVFITDTNGVEKSGYVKNATTHDEFGVIVDGDWEPLHIDNLTVCNFSPFAQAENKDELLKFDMLEDEKQKERGLYHDLIQFMGKRSNLFFSIIDAKELESIFLKYHESANSEKKYTEEDMRKCFNYSRTFKITSAESYQVNSLLKYIVFRNFEDYLKTLKND